MLVCAGPWGGQRAEVDVEVFGEGDVGQCGGDDGGVGAARLEQAPDSIAEVAAARLHQWRGNGFGAPVGVDRTTVDRTAPQVVDGDVPHRPGAVGGDRFGHGCIGVSPHVPPEAVAGLGDELVGAQTEISVPGVASGAPVRICAAQPGLGLGEKGMGYLDDGRR